MTLQENIQSLIDKAAGLNIDPRTIKDCVTARGTLTEISKECTSLRKQIQDHRQAKKKPRKSKPKLETVEEEETLEVESLDSEEESNTEDPSLVPAVEHPVKSPRPDFIEPLNEPQATPKPKRVRIVVAF